MDLWSVFQKGGPIMWPLLLTSLISLAVVLERLFFIVREQRSRRPAVIADVLLKVEQEKLPDAIAAGEQSDDFVVRTLVHGLKHRDSGLANALLQSANQELRRFSQGLTVLDTAITLAPLLGLLGTVSGMIRSFGLLGSAELSAPTVITGGIAEALIATAIGLAAAIPAVVLYNHFIAEIKRQEMILNNFSTDFLNIVKRNFFKE